MVAGESVRLPRRRGKAMDAAGQNPRPFSKSSFRLWVQEEQWMLQVQTKYIKPAVTTQKATGNTFERELDIFLQFVLEMVSLPPDIQRRRRPVAFWRNAAGRKPSVWLGATSAHVVCPNEEKSNPLKAPTRRLGGAGPPKT